MYDNHRVNKGLSLLSQGYIKEADEIFCDLLKQYPDFAEALYGRACVARTTGNQALAIGFAGQAIQIKSISYYHIPLGLALYEQGHVVEAEAALKSAVLLNPYDSRAHHGLAIIQEGNGDKAQAELSFRKAIELEPTSLIYWKELIRFYWQGKAFQQALNIAKDAVKYNVGKVEFLHELAVILYQLGEFGDAERVFRKIIRLNPETISAYANLGAILFQCHQLKEAQKYLTYAFQKEPENIETQVNLGLVQMGLGLLLEAKTLLSNAYQQKKNDSRIALNLGTILYELRDLDAAEKLYRVLLAPSYSFPIIENDRYKIKYNLSTVLLAKGQLVEGWDQMESRHFLLNHFKELSKIPLWNGKDKVGKLLVRVEQGLGDALQFSRYLPLLLQKCSIVVEVPKLLIRLFQQIMCNHHQEYSWEIIEKEHQFPSDITHQIMLMSIPHVLQIDHIKEYQLSLNVNQEEMLPKTLNKFKVGICWFGNKEYRFDLLRSIPISKFTSILQVSDIDFYALQTDLKKTDIPKYFLGALPNGDLLKTANIIQQLDLVITVDTMIAHLAGMLGKPVWLLNRFGGDWRWYSPYQHHRKSLWYPNFKIFQQQQILPPDQAWNAVIEEVKAELVLFTS